MQVVVRPETTSVAGGAPTFADALVAEGATAIPALVEACDEDTLTLAASSGPRGTHVVTVGDAALRILARIAPDVLHGPAGAHTWWLRKSADPTASALIDRIVARDDALGAARRLVADHAEIAFWPVTYGWATTQEDLDDPAGSNAWIELLGHLDDPRVGPARARRARRGGRLTPRVASVVELGDSNAPESLALAEHLAEWLHEESHCTPSRRPG